MSLTGHNMRRRRRALAKVKRPQASGQSLAEKNQKAIEQAMVEGDGQEAEASAPDLDEMTVDGLRTYAKEKSIKLVRGVSRKEEIAAVIKEALAKQEG